MKPVITIIIFLVAVLSVHSSVWDRDGSITANQQGLNQTKIITRPNFPQSRDESSEVMCRDITLTAAGTLAEALGEDAMLIDSLIVSGPINEADFKTMWNASFNYNLEVIDLENAVPENNIIPSNAFWDYDIQTYDNYVVSILLKKIILPDCVTEIGSGAFFFASLLEEVKLPASLVKIGSSAFTDCRRLTTIVFPANLEIIGNSAFGNCYKLDGDVVLPENLRIIEKLAFYQCGISSIYLPNILETIGNWAFADNYLKEVVIPDNCTLESGGCQFFGNLKLEKIHLPATLTTIPEACLGNCIALKEVDLPDALVCIGVDSFHGCMSLQSISLPESLESIDKSAFNGCISLEEIVLPSSLKTIGDYVFEDTGLKKIYSKATVAPMCTPNTFRNVPNTTPLYIPVGSRNDYVSLENYWYNFINIIETDDFPSLSVSDIDVDGGDEADAPVYDLMGRRVDSPQPGQIYIRAGKKFTVKP